MYSLHEVSVRLNEIHLVGIPDSVDALAGVADCDCGVGHRHPPDPEDLDASRIASHDRPPSQWLQRHSSLLYRHSNATDLPFGVAYDESIFYCGPRHNCDAREGDRHDFGENWSLSWVGFIELLEGVDGQVFCCACGKEAAGALAVAERLNVVYSIGGGTLNCVYYDFGYDGFSGVISL